MHPMWGWAPAPPDPWRDNRGFARLAALLWVAASALQTVITVRVRPRSFAELRAGQGGVGGLVASSLAGLAVSLAAGAGLVCVIVATWRLAKAHGQLGRPQSSWGPGWAIAGRLIPLASAVLPALQLGELWRGSDPGLGAHDPGWKARPRHPAAIASLVAMVACGAIGMVGFVIGFATTFDEVSRSTSTSAEADARFDRLVHDLRGWTIAASIVGTIGVALQAWLVVRIAERQQALHEAEPVPPPPTGGPSFAWHAPSQPAGWYPDPSGRFEWRWWDGAAWGAHVSRDGLVAHDPPPGGWRG